jgi:hypothetical protein
MLIPLIKLDTNKVFLYYTDDHTAYYATLSNWKTPDNCSWVSLSYIREDTTTHINGIE